MSKQEEMEIAEVAETEATETEATSDRTIPTQAKRLVGELYAELNAEGFEAFTEKTLEALRELGKKIVDSSTRNIPAAEKLRKLDEQIAALSAAARNENGEPRPFTLEEMTNLQKLFVKRNNLLGRKTAAPAE